MKSLKLDNRRKFLGIFSTGSLGFAFFKFFPFKNTDNEILKDDKKISVKIHPLAIKRSTKN